MPKSAKQPTKKPVKKPAKKPAVARKPTKKTTAKPTDIETSEPTETDIETAAQKAMDMVNAETMATASVPWQASVDYYERVRDTCDELAQGLRDEHS